MLNEFEIQGEQGTVLFDYKKWLSENPKAKIALISLGVLFVIYLGISTWSDKLHRADKQVYRSWGMLKESSHRRVQLLPDYIQWVQYYAPQAKDLLNVLTQTYQQANQFEMTDQIMVAPQSEQAFYEIQKSIVNALKAVEKQTSSSPMMAQNHQFFILNQHRQEVEKAIAGSALILNKQIDRYNPYVVGFPQETISELFYNYPPRIHVRVVTLEGGK